MPLPNRLFLLAALAAVVLAPAPTRADAPELLSYQGVLTLADGSTVDDGDYTIDFRLYEQPSLGIPLYGKMLTVGVKDGIYNVLLSTPDIGNPLAQVFKSGTQRYMELEVLTGPGVASPFTLDPRQQIASVPYALDAGSSMPTGAIILWDTDNTCPSGFEEAMEFERRVPMGADRAGLDPNIDDNVEGLGGSFTTSGPAGVKRKGTVDSNVADDLHTHTVIPPHRTVLFCRKL
ncbi:MAG: hypothetical protein GY937_08650 [bacterium]|nr:hypothetical protein [bacterium]